MPESANLSLDKVRHAQSLLEGRVLKTPVHPLRSPAFVTRLGSGTRVTLKLELFQLTGSFKARGALLSLLRADPKELARGVTAVSAGNHAIAVAYAAREVGVPARVVMLAKANPLRRKLAEAYGAEVVPAATIQEAFELVEELRVKEGLFLVHPFEGESVALGTATLGLEFLDQVPDLDAVIVPIGGGGLAAGVSFALKASRPHLRVYGVEPVGADSMTRSLSQGSPQKVDQVTTIADSLGAPYALPYSFSLCRDNLDGCVRVTDAELLGAMAVSMEVAKLAVEPAGAAALAALLGPLKETLSGAHVGLIVCGTNMDLASYQALMATPR
jgi:threonine dehydratase